MYNEIIVKNARKCISVNKIALSFRKSGSLNSAVASKVSSEVHASVSKYGQKIIRNDIKSPINLNTFMRNYIDEKKTVWHQVSDRK